MKLLPLLLLCLLSSTFLWSQQKYWIFLTDKGNESNKSYTTVLYRPYVSQLQNEGLKVLNHSKWLNAVAVEGEIHEGVRVLPFIDKIESVGRPMVSLSTNDTVLDVEAIQVVLRQMQGEAFLEHGLSGKEVKVGIIDAGYNKAKSVSALNRVLETKQVKAYRNFVDSTILDYDTPKLGSSHGRKVLTKIAGYESDDKRLIGFAPNAAFYLASSENTNQETKVEEYDWVRALEWMDSLGVKLVNSSLGYAEFDNEEENYLKTQMNGEYGITSRAAQIAVKERGMLLVISAGNAGAKPWQLVTVPGDAKDVLTVGATELKGPVRISYSSIGPDYTAYLKPDVSTHSPNGTSFSAPVVTGFMACLMEYAPDLSSLELMEVARKSSGLYPYGNNYVGYGVPNADEALRIVAHYRASDSLKTLNAVKKVHSKNKKVRITTIDFPTKDLAFFHKKDHKAVVSQFLLSPYAQLEFLKQNNIRIKRSKTKFSVILKRPKGVERTTVLSGNEVVEIIWLTK